MQENKSCPRGLDLILAFQSLCVSQEVKQEKGNPVRYRSFQNRTPLNAQPLNARWRRRDDHQHRPLLPHEDATAHPENIKKKNKEFKTRGEKNTP